MNKKKSIELSDEEILLFFDKEEYLPNRDEVQALYESDPLYRQQLDDRLEALWAEDEKKPRPYLDKLSPEEKMAIGMMVCPPEPVAYSDEQMEAFLQSARTRLGLAPLPDEPAYIPLDRDIEMASVCSDSGKEVDKFIVRIEGQKEAEGISISCVPSVVICPKCHKEDELTKARMSKIQKIVKDKKRYSVPIRCSNCKKSWILDLRSRSDKVVSLLKFCLNHPKYRERVTELLARYLESSEADDKEASHDLRRSLREIAREEKAEPEIHEVGKGEFANALQVLLVTERRAVIRDLIAHNDRD